MRTRCKFRVTGVTQYEGPQEQVVMSAVHGDVGENISFSKWTPCGEFKFSVTNPDVIGKYKPGQEVYIDITPVE